ncbi:O-antigen ligase family protein [Patescibacteria group bacterium]|nr:O-antigen ligase family protein [Patescibacteria group bacterium]
MNRFLTSKSIFFQKQTAWLIVLFFLIRISSFLLDGQIVIQGILVFILLMLLGILYFKNPDWAWMLVLGEIFLGGSGHYLEFVGLSIRTLFIGFFLFLWASQHLGQKILISRLKIHKYLNWLISFLFLTLFFSFLNGIYHGHVASRVIQDFMPFTFLLLIFPSYHLFKNPKIQEYLVRLLIVFVIGTAIFSIITFIIFSLGLTEIHEPFYNWYRMIDVGKITYMGHGFFRIVEASHLIIVPLILIITSLLMRNEKHHKMWRLLLLCSVIILVLNLSRGYFLALIIGLLVLKYKHNWIKWLKESLFVIILITVVFSGVSFTASGGTTFGWELFGLRLKSFIEPTIEISTNTRMMILPRILDVIKANPIGGVGLGAVITFTNYDTYESITTPAFDWGYFEMWAEMGLIGSLALIFLYCFAGYALYKKIKTIPDWHDFDVGLLAGIIAFLVMNITMAALFHVFGILFLIFTLTIATKYTSIFDRTTALLYQIFNRIK